MGAKPMANTIKPAGDLLNHSWIIPDQSPFPMAMVEGAAHVVCSANPAFCRLMAKPANQIVGKPFHELLPEKDECVTLLNRVLRTRNPESHTEQENFKAHPVFWSYTMWPVLAAKRFRGIVIQVTETAEFHGKMVAMNQALMSASMRQHQLTEAALSSNSQLQSEITERKQAEEAHRRAYSARQSPRRNGRREAKASK